MRKRILANNLQVSAIGLGCMGLSYPPFPSKADAIQTIRKAVELGVTLSQRVVTHAGTESPLTEILHPFTVLCFINRLKIIMLN